MCVRGETTSIKRVRFVGLINLIDTEHMRGSFTITIITMSRAQNAFGRLEHYWLCHPSVWGVGGVFILVFL